MTEARLVLVALLIPVVLTGCSKKEEAGPGDQGETGQVEGQESPSAGVDAIAAEAPLSPENGGPRGWRVKEGPAPVELREEPSETAAVLATYAAGTILDNLGTRRGKDRTWCDVQELGGGPRGFLLPEQLEPAVSPDGTVATGPDDSALRAGQEDFDVTGTLVCTQGPDRPIEACAFGVSRAGGGYATVVIQRPQGHPRTIYFRMGKPIGAGTVEADPRGEFQASREGDLHVIHLGEERYEIPDMLLYGR